MKAYVQNAKKCIPHFACCVHMISLWANGKLPSYYNVVEADIIKHTWIFCNLENIYIILILLFSLEQQKKCPRCQCSIGPNYSISGGGFPSKNLAIQKR
jgi:hypothetical protein